jgi:hypothetical protein
VGNLRFTSLLYAVGFVFVAGPTFAATNEEWVHATYRCSAKDTATLEGNGTLGKAEHLRKGADGIIIDTLTGAVSWPVGVRHVWRVVQKGSANRDYLLVQAYPIPMDADNYAAGGADSFIRIRAHSKPVTFMLFELLTLITGTCEVVR